MFKLNKPLLLPVIFVSLSVLSETTIANEEIGIESKEDLKAYLESFRESRSLLKKGQSRVSSTFIYQNDSPRTFVGENINKTFSIQTGFEYGVSPRLNIYGSLSFSDSSFLSRSLLNNESTKTNVNSNSYSIGGKYSLILEDDSTPEIVLDLSASKNRSSTSSASIDNKSVDIRLNAIKSFDPMILIGSIGANHNIDRNDTSLNLSAGLAFGINDRIALGSSVSYQTPLSGNFKENNDTASINGRVTITKGKNIIEPSISFGLTDISPDMTLSLTWSRRFK